MKPWLSSLTMAALLAPSALARADVFDYQTPSDDTTATENELIHRVEQVHDLAAKAGVEDADWYRISQKPYSSYEVVIDQTSADVSPIVLQRIGSDGTTVLATAEAISGIRASRTLRWENATTSTIDNQYIKVTSGSCTSGCNTTTVYRIRVFDTTYMIPRFYNNGPDVSSLVLQNPTNGSITYHAEFWSDGGIHLDTRSVTLGPRSLDVWAVSGTALTNKTGSVTVTATAGYGELFGKVSQIELTTLGGLVNEAWDHPMLPKP
jgi:hypothetical protein